jgi:hypothetical protein
MLKPVAFIDVPDGLSRPVYEEPNGRQYVIGDEGEALYGVWYIPQDDSDLPVIVEMRR